MSLASRYQTELLAPAGSVEAFFAAMEAGADAVYCGLKKFSARAKAKNFTLVEIENLCAYTHQYNCKLYVPFNTLIKEDELPQLIDLLEGLAQCRPDGLIIQDLGVYNLIHQFFPEIPLHASTQMAIHNAAGVQMLEQMGFERAVLARELSFAEIKAIHHETTIELEHFVHGALCYSISGHCLFSSFQTGNSGNRGGCAQPCRRQYSQQNNTSGLPFSTADLNSLCHVPELVQSGIMSFKIEGRMKNSEYVWNVVRAYRTVLDCPTTNLPDVIQEGEAILKESYGRQTTAGFLTKNTTTILLPHQKGGIGKNAGQIKHVRGKAITFTSRITLHIGDKLRIQPKTDQPGTTFTIRDIQIGRKRIKQARPRQTITISTPFYDHFKTDDHIFKISSGRGFTLSEEACRRRLTTATITPTPIDINISCTTQTFTVTTTAPCTYTEIYNIETCPAQKSPLNLTILTKIFKKTAHPEIILHNIQAEDLPPLVIKPSRLKAVRRDFYQKFTLKLEKRTQNQAQRRIEDIQHTLTPPPSLTDPHASGFFIQIEQPHQDLVTDPDLTLILPLTTKLNPQETRENFIWDIPAILYGSAWQKIQKQIHEKQDMGYKKFRLNNISHFMLFKNPNKLQLMAGPTLYCLNQKTIHILKQQNIQQITTSLEDDKINIAAIRKHSRKIIVPIYGKIPLMTSRIPLSTDDTITTPTEEKLHSRLTGEITEIYASTPFSLSGYLQDLHQMGISGFLIDLREHATRERQVILTDIKKNKIIPRTTLFNYRRGLV